MGIRSVVTIVITAAVAAAVGFGAGMHLKEMANSSSARASILATGEFLRSGDVVAAMTHAQGIIHAAPGAYDGYQLAGDVYRVQGFTPGARRMYEEALRILQSGGTASMLVEAGATNVDTAAEHLRRKLDDLPE